MIGAARLNLMRPHAAASSGSLLTGLAAGYQLDEASGAAAVDVMGLNNLTSYYGGAVGPGSTTGRVGNCRSFDFSQLQWLTAPSSTELSTADEDWTIMLWLNATTSGGRYVASKFDASGQSWYISYNSATGVAYVEVLNGVSTTIGSVSATLPGGGPFTGVWVCLAAWHDSVANTVNIQLNNGTVYSSPTTGAAGASTAVFRIGSLGYVAFEVPFDGLIDEFYLWKKVLSGSEMAMFWGSGAGLPFSSWT